MNCVAEDIMNYLDMEYAGLTKGTNLFCNKEPASPANCVTIFETTKLAPGFCLTGAVNYDRSNFMIRVRNTNQKKAWTLAEGLKNFLHGLYNIVIDETVYQSIKCSRAPQYYNWDESDKCRVIVTFEVQRRSM